MQLIIFSDPLYKKLEDIFGSSSEDINNGFLHY